MISVVIPAVGVCGSPIGAPQLIELALEAFRLILGEDYVVRPSLVFFVCSLVGVLRPHGFEPLFAERGGSRSR